MSSGFSFGAPTAPTPAPFSFGGTPAAPAPPTAFSFGNPAPAPAFGAAAPAPVFAAAPTTTFGTAPTASFGAAPATTFGAAPPTAFGAAPTTPTFGAPPAPAFGFGAPAPAFGSAQPAAGVTQTTSISSTTPYSALPPDIRQAIDTIHEAIMKHKRTMVSLQSMAPKELLPEDLLKKGLQGTGNSRTQPAPLAITIRQLHQNIAALEHETGLQKLVDSCKDDYETLIKQAVMYGQWQIESLAVRKGVHLKQQQSSQTDGKGNTGQDSAKAQLQAVLDRQIAHVDRLERMPSPYLWQVLEDLEKRLNNLKHYAVTVQQQIHNSLRSDEPADIPSIVQSQHRALHKVVSKLAHLHSMVDQIRQQYRFYEKGENVLERAHFEEQQRDQRLNDRIQMQYVQAAASSTQAPAAACPAPTGAFGASTATTTAAKPPAFGFGATPAPAPTGTSAFSFGSAAPATTAPAPSGANLFGGTPAPTTGVFGSTSTPAPAPGAPAPAPFSFSSTPASSSSATPKSSKNKTRNKSRLGR